MAAIESDLHAFLEERLRDLKNWHDGALEIGELRDSDAVQLAKSNFFTFVCYSWDHGEGDIDGALVIALETFIEFSAEWSADPAKALDELGLSGSPRWELTEFTLVVASMLADAALEAFEIGTKKKLKLAAMLYADAVEAREMWNATRGPARARNTNTRRAKMHQVALSFDERIAGRKARKETAQIANRARLAKDPKQSAKVAAHLLWQEREMGKHPVLRTEDQFAMEVCRRWSELTSIGTVKKWSTAWRKHAKAIRRQ
ncbi:MAG: hypothetical protein ACREO8_02815 [Luteimonas sp.]